MTDRRKNLLVLLVVAGLLVASLVVIITQPTKLGLDLRGGVQLIYEGKATAQSKVNSESLERAVEIMRKRVDQLGVSEPEIQLSGEKEITVALPDVSNAARAQNEVGKTAQLQFYDWEPNVIGPEGKPEPTEASVTGGANAGSAASGVSEYDAIQRALKRPVELHTPSTTWTPGCTEEQGAKGTCLYGTWYLIEPKHEKVLCPGGKPYCQGAETEQALYAGYTPPKGAVVKAVRVPPGTVLVQARPVENAEGKKIVESPNRWYALKDVPVLDGSDVTNPVQGFDEGNGGSGQPNVSFGFTEHGKTVFERVTKEIAERGRNALLPGVSKANSVQHFAIVLDGQLITVPSIDFEQYPTGIDATNGSEISGGFTISSAQELASELQSGALPIRLALISRSQVSATLGKTALKQALVAGLLGFLIVCVFLLLFYRVLGAIAVGGLVIYGIYFFALIKLIPITMTLPGIAGLVLTIGVAADANIVIFERVKEEIRSGRSVIAGIATGYKKGFAAIVDANVVTFMTAFILFALATSEVKGFAFTLGIGTLVSLFTAVLATQAALGVMSSTGVVTHPHALGASKQSRRWTFDFMGHAKWFFSLSGTILLIGALAVGGKGLNFSFDFTGGTRIQTAFDRPATTAQINEEMTSLGITGVQVQKISDASVGGSGYQISTATLSPEKLVKVETALQSRFGVKDFSEKSIGATFGQEVANSAVIAIIASLLVISAYIALRFEWKYAVPVLIALMHDLLITAGVYSLTGREVTTATVAALLTILGYSLYDTIIVFDRIRENVPRMPRAAFSQVVNRSMSEVLTRSLATTFCTLLPVTALLLFGGETLGDFAFALIVGIASGAYSSIFIASPVLMEWKEREPTYRARRARIVSELGAVPAYAVGTSGKMENVEPERKRRTRRGSLIAAEAPGEQLSGEEFRELVRDIEPETKPATAVAEPPAPAPPAPAPEPKPEHAADLTPEDLVLKDEPKRERSKRGRNRRHGRPR